MMEILFRLCSALLLGSLSAYGNETTVGLHSLPGYLAYQSKTFVTTSLLEGIVCYLPSLFTLLANPFALITLNMCFWKRFPNSTYAIPFRDCSMTSVRYGTRLFKKQRGKDITAFLLIFSLRSAIFTSPYIKAPMLPQRNSLLPPMRMTQFCTGQSRIHSAPSLAIIQTRPLTFLFLSPHHQVIHPMPCLPRQPTAPTPPRHKPSK